MLTVTGARRVLVDPRTERDGDVVVDDGSDVASTLDASGCVVTPGLVNAHHHLLQTAFRTLPGTRGVPMADWLPTMAQAYARVGHDPELYGLAASAGAAEGLLSGVTTIADHHLNWPADATTDDTVALAAATVDAVRGLGGRLVFVRGSARDDAQRAATSADAIASGLLHAEAVGGVDPDGLLQVAVGPAGVHSDGEATFRALGEVAARHGLRRRTQANEQVDTAIALERYGRRPLDLLDEWGWLAPDVTIAHLCDVTDDEITRIAASGASATHAPGCDVPMGWGIAPVARLAAAGITVGLGTSGGGSNDAGHLLADGRLAMQVSALVGPQLPARQVLGMMTEGSAVGLGRPELGHLGAGSAGDLCVWDVSGVADAGVDDVVAGLLWASPGRRPRHVVVGGRVVVRDGRLVSADEREVAARLAERLARTPAR
ncbi:amidohydrolase family protein [Curtobacterium sp. MCBA15_008]|uniref:amidohydrolase family protein n=1 Tax=Curtobacterium sp. MCBA15_008 TaxID=1898736 RepID=UPI0008DE63DD|nr:amidohydrolase family protein [Curtobacterium sp. MCBA15_008]OII04015.1 hydroxyatrazine ethylaminohydrolase [Curtobacterium sp. MCBA15_008]